MLAEAIATCATTVGSDDGGSSAGPDGRTVELPACYRGRRHLDCVVAILLDEASAIDREYGEIVRSSYPDLKDTDAICRIEPRRIEEHAARARTFDTRLSALRKAFDASAACVEEVRQAISAVDLGSMQNASVLMKSMLDSISAPIDRAAAWHRSLLRLVQGIDASRKAMGTVRRIRALVCP